MENMRNMTVCYIQIRYIRGVDLKIILRETKIHYIFLSVIIIVTIPKVNLSIFKNLSIV